MGGVYWPLALKHILTVMVVPFSAKVKAPTCFRRFLVITFKVLNSFK